MTRAARPLACRVVEIGDLALYNEDLDNGTPPQAWTRFRGEIDKAAGVIFAIADDDTR